MQNKCLGCDNLLNPGAKKFCSRACLYNSQRITLTCQQCSKPFQVAASDIKFDPCKFCSRVCSDANKCKNLTVVGQKYGKRTALGHPFKIRNQYHVECQCECGTIDVVRCSRYN
jgi:hypothetical protein